MSHTFYRPKGKKKTLFDDLMYPLGLAGPIVTFPQLLTIWTQKNTHTISIITWGAYAALSGCWLIYGLAHKEKPIILSNFLTLILDSLIVLGILIYR